MNEPNASQGGLRKSRFHDEKGNRIALAQFYEPLLAGTLRVSQSLMDRPYLPWVPFAVLRKMSRILNKDSRVLEFGSGRSTIWLARHAHSVTSIENQKLWYDKVSDLFKKLEMKNVDYRFLSGDAYCSVADFADESFDLIIVDGDYRNRCVESSHGKLKRGGYLYLDNSDADMTTTDGAMRMAEAKMHQLAKDWSSAVEFYTGFPPGNMHAHQGALLKRQV